MYEHNRLIGTFSTATNQIFICNKLPMGFEWDLRFQSIIINYNW